MHPAQHPRGTAYYVKAIGSGLWQVASGTAKLLWRQIAWGGNYIAESWYQVREKSKKTEELNADLTKKIEAYNKKITDLDDTVKRKVTDHLNGLHAEIYQLETTISRLKDEEQPLKEQLSRLARQTGDLESEIRRLNYTKKELQLETNHLKDLKDDEENITRRVQNLKEDEHNIRSKVRQLQIDKKDLEKTIQSLKDKIDLLRDNLSDLEREERSKHDGKGKSDPHFRPTFVFNHFSNHSSSTPGRNTSQRSSNALVSHTAGRAGAGAGAAALISYDRDEEADDRTVIPYGGSAQRPSF